MASFKKIVASATLVGCLLVMGKSGLADLSGLESNAFDTREVIAYDGEQDNAQILGYLNVNENFRRVLSGDKRDLVNNNNWLFFVDKGSVDAVDDLSVDTTYRNVSSIAATTAEVNFRVGPGTEYDSLYTIKKNTPVELVAYCDNGWYLVRTNFTLGFIKGEYLETIDFNSLYREMANMPEIIRVVQLDKDSNIREYPTVDSKKLTTLKTGYKLKMNRLLDNGWYEVEKDGHIGYIRGDLVHECYAIAGNCIKIVYSNSGGEVFDSPYGNKIGNLPGGQSAFVYGEVNGFYLIEKEGHVGYIRKSDCKVLDNDVVIVDISDQRMYIYKDNQLVFAPYIVSGKNTTQTPTGLYTVDKKEEERLMVGPDYEVLSKWCVHVVNGIWLHGSKRSVFGPDANYQENGSHGCINQSIKDAEKTYSLVDRGAKVVIQK